MSRDFRNDRTHDVIVIDDDDNRNTENDDVELLYVASFDRSRSPVNIRTRSEANVGQRVGNLDDRVSPIMGRTVSPVLGRRVSPVLGRRPVHRGGDRVSVQRRNVASNVNRVPPFQRRQIVLPEIVGNTRLNGDFRRIAVVVPIVRPMPLENFIQLSDNNSRRSSGVRTVSEDSSVERD